MLLKTAYAAAFGLMNLYRDAIAVDRLLWRDRICSCTYLAHHKLESVNIINWSLECLRLLTFIIGVFIVVSGVVVVIIIISTSLTFLLLL